MNKRLIVIASAVVLVVLLSLITWNFLRYEATVLSLTYETTPIMSSPLSDADFTWKAKAYSARIFGNSPFGAEGYIHRERTTSENRFRHTEFNSLNVSLRLQFQVTNATGYVICNKTLYASDGCDREITFEFKPEGAKAGNTLQIRIILSLNVNYSYGPSGEPKAFALQREWTRTMQIQQAEPAAAETL